MMEGKEKLNNLPESIKQQISSRYESLDKFYTLVIILSKMFHNAFLSKNQEIINIYNTNRNKIAHELEEFGIKDGYDIFDEISTDYDEHYVKTNYQMLTPEQKELLQHYGIK